MPYLNGRRPCRASDKCQREKRKTINGDDLVWAMGILGFEEYGEPLKQYLHKYREAGPCHVKCTALIGAVAGKCYWLCSVSLSDRPDLSASCKCDRWRKPNAPKAVCTTGCDLQGEKQSMAKQAAQGKKE